ncbi:MAG: mandelate racemase/muconate lactonizing enzyme family protein [Oscillospiraceae bacterium]|nr:mandelate racemase/muconate lactonizing enzyme family protein [Oscillospiraceae bacterium]
MRFTEVVGAPMHCTLMKIMTNQGLEGCGELRDASSRTYAAMLKSRIVGENPCDVDRIFRRVKQFGGHSRQGGGVSGIEAALWDLAGKAYGVPVHRMLGGRFRDRVRIYCDTDAGGRDGGKAMGEALRRRMDLGYTFLKMDLGLGTLAGVAGAVSAPLGYLGEMGRLHAALRLIPEGDWVARANVRNRMYELNNVAHPFTGIRLTEKGLVTLSDYVGEVRGVIGHEVPLAIDHIGHVCVEDCIALARRLERHNVAWLEDLVPWQYTDQYVRLKASTTVPICTGEDIYLKEGFRPLLEAGGVSIIHPDVLTAGGILETKKIGDMAQEAGVAMALHMAEGPAGCMAAVQVAAATENFLALEYHSVDCDWWGDMVTGLPRPIVDGGWIEVPDGPGLGFETFNDEALAMHLHPDWPRLWMGTEEWDGERSADKLWS